MPSEKDLREVEKKEDASINLVDASKENCSDQDQDMSKYCNNCKAFKLVSEYTPYSSIKNESKKAICLEIDGVIKSSLKNIDEWTNIPKPLYCPKLGRELTEKEQKKADRMMDWAIRMME